nr:ATP-binding protein [Spiroplasma clarkii]
MFFGGHSKNIDYLLSDIKATNGHSIIIIDEFDSIVGNRENSTNDEYKRMIGTFNLMLDDIPNGAIVFAITNKVDQLDSAILRRFNLTIRLDTVKIEHFINLLRKKCELNNIDIDVKLIEKIFKSSNLSKDEIEGNFLTLSLVDSLVDNNIFFNKNIYQCLFEKINSEISAIQLYDNGFNYSEIGKIIDKDQRTVKK